MKRVSLQRGRCVYRLQQFKSNECRQSGMNGNSVDVAHLIDFQKIPANSLILVVSRLGDV